MEKYKDISMDYADAALVSLADDLAIQHIVTFDSHFDIYRLSSLEIKSLNFNPIMF
jgi:predicted nucleic acid-binding protein